MEISTNMAAWLIMEVFYGDFSIDQLYEGCQGELKPSELTSIRHDGPSSG